MNIFSKNTGNFITITGILHIVLGLSLNWKIAKEIVRFGLINTADKNADWFGFFWYEINGLFVMFTGALLQCFINESGKQIPRKFGWYLLLIALVGCLMEPLSGFYVYIIISGLIIFQKIN